MTENQLIQEIAMKGGAIKRGIIGSAFIKIISGSAVVTAIIWECVNQPSLVRIGLWLVAYLISSELARNVLPTQEQISEFNTLVDKIKGMSTKNEKQ